jgi:hypothetical protein
MSAETTVMKNELRFLNLLCLLAALLFVVMAILNAVFSGQLLTTDNLFITMVCLVMALVFAVIPVLQLKDEGRLPIPFAKRLGKKSQDQFIGASTPPLLDAKGRAVPPDVKSMVTRMRQAETKD